MSIEKYSRLNPYSSIIQERFLLTGPSSTKKTYHISLRIDNSNFPFKVGDSIAVLPQNDPEEVNEILHKMRLSGSETIFDPKTSKSSTVQEYLLHKANISRMTLPFLKTIFETESDLLLLESKEQLTPLLHTHSLLDVVSTRLLRNPSDLTKLMPLLPRFYSIANSPLTFSNEIHLTVAFVSYVSHGQERKGVGSHFLCTLAEPEKTLIPIYLQPSQNFTLPANPNTSIILIGPGTGVAPFRAFLQDRIARGATGRNWLFFGERNRATDFYYENFWTELVHQGRLRLDLAFSRDTIEKTYVQHKMYEERKSLWNWIQDGSYVYLCGDATEMAKEVDATLHRIVKEEGEMSEEGARLYIKRLRTEKRYLSDVY